MLERLDRFADRLVRITLPWWGWPAILVAMAVSATSMSLFFQPLGTEWVALPNGDQFGETCGMIQATGQPCPQCGMTRSWVHGVRLNLRDAFFYNPAGVTLLLWIQAGGLIGMVRLITRNPRSLRPPQLLLAGWIFFWFLVLYLGGFILRLAGVLPLPGIPNL